MSVQDRFVLALEHYEKALERLREVLAENETDFIRDALIKRFEFTFETAWNAMYRWLRVRDVKIAQEAFEVIPRAFNAGLITDDAGWTEMRKSRNLTSHAYTEEKAVAIAAFVREKGISLFDTLAARLRQDA